MKCTIYMAISVDGFIAGPNNETPWSNAEWECYHTHIQQNDALIVGRVTHELMRDYDEYERLGNPNVIVVSRSQSFSDGVATVSTPNAALETAALKGYDSVLVGGGTKLNSAFLEAQLAQYLHLDIEPIILKDGISLFNPADHRHELTLLKSEVLTSGTISVDYKIS